MPASPDPATPEPAPPAPAASPAAPETVPPPPASLPATPPMPVPAAPPLPAAPDPEPALPGLPVAPAAPAVSPAEASWGKNGIDPKPLLSTPQDAIPTVASPTTMTIRAAPRGRVVKGRQTRIMIMVSRYRERSLGESSNTDDDGVRDDRNREPPRRRIHGGGDGLNQRERSERC